MKDRHISLFIITIILFMLCSAASAELTVSESASHEEIGSEQVSRDVLETANSESSDSSAFRFTNSTNEACAGDTVSISYERIRDDITIVSAWWINKGTEGSGGSLVDIDDQTSGTLTFSVGRGSQC